MKRFLIFIIIFTYTLFAWTQNTFNKIDYIRQNKDGEYLLIAKQGELYGVFGLTGDTILNAEYTYISYEQDSLFFLTKDSLRGIIDIDGKTLVPTVYNSITSFPKDNFYILEKDNQYGIWNRKNKKISIQPMYDFLKPSDGYRSGEKSVPTAIVYKWNPNKQCGLVNLSTGEQIFEVGLYDHIMPYDEFGCATVSKNNRYAVMDYNRMLVIESEYPINVIPNGFLMDNENGKQYYISRANDMKKTSKEYDYILPIDDLLIIQDGKLYGVMNSDAKVIIPPKYSNIYIGKYTIDAKNNIDSDNSETKVFKRNGKLVYKSKSNLRLTYDNIKDVFVVSKDNKEGLLNGKGKEIIPIQYRGVYPDNTSNLIKLEEEDYKKGLANTKGKIIASPKYNKIEEFVNGVALVGFAKNSKSYEYGLIDTLGKEITTPQFSSVFFDLDDEKMYATIYEKNQVGILSRKDGKVTVPPIYNRIIYQDRTGDDWVYVAIMEKEKKKGVVNISTAEILAEPIYKHVFSMGQSDSILFCLRTQEGNTIIDKTGKVIIPFTPDVIYPLETGKNKYLNRRNENKKNGVVTNNNENIIPMIYDNVTLIYDQLFRVKIGDKFGVVNSENEIILPIEYDLFTPYLYSYNNLIIAKKGDRKGFYDLKKMEFIESPFYDLFAK